MSRFTLEPAELSWSDAGEPVSERFGDVYFSKDGGLEETDYVFLQQNHLARRWRQWPAGKSHYCIAETGFGTGLNFLAAWRLWNEIDPPGQLHFISCEKYPLRPADLARSLKRWPELAPLAGQLQAQYPPLLEGVHRLSFAAGRVQLTLLFGDALDGLNSLLDGGTLAGFTVDSWFLDGFAPAKNADLWTEQLFQRIGQLSAVGSTFATFTSAGAVKRGLQAAGFQVSKVPGFGRKREMLAGEMLSEQSPTPPGMTPWYQAPRVATGSALVIGAGLAGCTTALALAQRGWQVKLLDQEAPGSGASGNRQGLLYAKLSAHGTPQSDFVLASYLYACRYYAGLDLPSEAGDLKGLLQLACDNEEDALQQKIAQAFAAEPGVVQRLDAAEASQLAGITLSQPALYFPSAGWLWPAEICRRLIQHPHIEPGFGRRVERLHHDGHHWHAQDEQGNTLASAELCIIATGTDANRFEQTHWLPLKPIRGQVSHLAATDASQALLRPISHDGYVAPASQGRHCAGATFHQNDPEASPRAEDDQHNLATLKLHLPALSDALGAPPQVVDQRVGWRTTAPDYQPIVGPVPDAEAFLQDYAALRLDARQVINTAPKHLPGLYVNTAHGARGLATAPLCAEWLAALIGGEVRPMPGQSLPYLYPGRFLIRQLTRGR